MPTSRKDGSLSEQAAAYCSTKLPLRNPVSRGEFIHDWGYCVKEYYGWPKSFERTNNLYALLTQLLDVIDFKPDVCDEGGSRSANIRQITYWMGKLSEERSLFSLDQVRVIKDRIQRVSQLLFSIGECSLYSSEKFLQEMSNTLYGLGQLVHTQWLYDLNDDFKFRLIGLFTVFSARIEESIRFPERNLSMANFQAQNISAVFYALHLMKNTSVFHQNANYDFISSLLKGFVYYIQNHPGERRSQDICFVIQGITTMGEQRLLPNNIDLTMLFNKLPAILFHEPDQTIKLVEHITKIIVCLGGLTDIHPISRADFTVLLALVSRCLRLMLNNNIDTSDGELVILNSAIKLSAKAGLQESEKERLALLSMSVNKVDRETFISRLDQVLIPAQPPSALHQPASFFSGPLMVTLPQASQGEFTTLKSWLQMVELRISLLQPLQTSSSAVIKSTVVNTLVEQAFTFFITNQESWKSQPNSLENARILIYGLGLLARYADRIQYHETPEQNQYNKEFSDLFNVLSDSIISYPLNPSSINAFINEVQFAFLGLRFICRSQRLFSNALRKSCDFAPSVDKLVTCLEGMHHEQSRYPLLCVLSAIQSLGAMVESSALRIRDGQAFAARLLNLLFKFSGSAEVPLIDLKGVVNSFRFLFRLNTPRNPVANRNIILNTLFIPFKRTSNQPTRYKCEVLTDFCSEIAFGLSLIDQNDDVQAIQVICNLMGLLHTPSRNMAHSLIDSVYQQIQQLLHKQLNVDYQPDVQPTSCATKGAQANELRYDLSFDDHILSCSSQYYFVVANTTDEVVYPSPFSSQNCVNSGEEMKDNMNARSKTGSSKDLRPENDARFPFSTQPRF